MTNLKLEIVTVRLPQGTLLKIDTVLKGGELRAAFIRAAVENELKRRENKRPAGAGLEKEVVSEETTQ